MMTKKEIKYIESDLESIIATQATKLDLTLQFKDIEEIRENDLLADIRETLMYLHKNYKLIKK